ncbi:MAG: T9SS type A sorting domain-containing protein, partial [candidate division Zixibacteria bacterium]|nr:T9SS type A sorting domain-containing protein [candidate division Zixibacteria bacterium]
NYPNPFNPDTRIDFDLPQSSRVALAVFNVLGRKVKTLINEQMPAGTHTVVWDGREDNGNPVASGVYLYRLETGSSVFTRKMMLLK